jgi:arsenite-transporting ATPase
MKRLFFPLVDVELNGVDALKEVGRYIFENGKGHLEIKSVKRAHGTFKLVKNIEKVKQLISPQDGTRFLFFTGKGGVGKSTVACAASVYLAKQGHRTLIVTTDPASHLQLIFGQDIGPEPTRIAQVDGLFAVRIDQKKALDEYRVRILAAVADQPEDVRKNVEEDLRSPCAEEMSAFEKFMSYFTIKGYDIVIFDTAPTGHTIRLLELPSDWTEFLDLGSLTKKTSKETRTKYADIIDTMRNRKKSTFIFVVYPEYTPIIEAWRASRELKKQVGIETSLVGVNYILPAEYGKNEFFENRRKQQEKYLAEISPRFGTPMFLIPLLDHEPMGVPDLERLGRTMFEDR